MDLYAAAPRTFLWPAAWLLSVGTVILAVAVWSIAGWHGVGVAGASLPPLRVQYDAAWAFAFAGASGDRTCHLLGMGRDHEMRGPGDRDQ